MNVGKYLRGDDRHVGSARVVNKGDEMKYALISQRQMIEIESAFETKRLFATVKDIETIDKALKILHLLKFSDAVEITGAELAKPEQENELTAWVTDEFAITYTADVAQRWRDKGWKVVPFYTAPPRKPWVGLTNEDWENTPDTGKKGCERDAEMLDWVEQTLKDKNDTI
jgi:hypothetical protein